MSKNIARQQNALDSNSGHGNFGGYLSGLFLGCFGDTCGVFGVYMGGNLLTVQSLILVSYFLYF